MAYDGNGVFVIDTAGQPVVGGTTISSTVFNALTADLANGLTLCVTKDGQSTTTASIPFAAGIETDTLAPATPLGPIDLAAGQLKWPASPNLSADPNTLDEYQEGAFVPTFDTTLVGPTGVTYAVQQGKYTRIGNRIDIQGRVTLTNNGTGGTGNIIIGNLPLANGSQVAVFNIYFDGLTLTAGLTQVTGIAPASSTFISLNQSGSGIASSGVPYSAASATTDFIFAGTYFP